MYQGDVSFILDNSALDARPYSAHGQNTEKPAYDIWGPERLFGGRYDSAPAHGQGSFSS